MRAALCIICVCEFLGLARPASAAAAPVHYTTINGRYQLSDAGLAEIRLLTVAAGICEPIDVIIMRLPDRATVWCGPIDARQQKRDAGYYIEFEVFRRHRRWFVDRSSFRMTGRLGVM